MNALIIGVNGQDGSYLAELLLSKNYEVHGTIRRSSVDNLYRIKHIKDNIILHYADLSDSLSITNILRTVMPDEIYNLGAQSDVKASFDIPEYSGDINGLGVLRLIEAMHQICPAAKLYNAATSELYGNTKEKIQTIKTPFAPVSPYAAAKLYGVNICHIYRDAYKMYIVNGICFNHESPRRGEEFVTMKICNALKNNMPLQLGNIKAKRDWGYAKEYVYGMWLALQQKNSDDYIFATAETHSVKEFLEEALKYCNYTSEITISDELYRPLDVPYLCGDYSDTEKKLGWKPQVKFKELIKIMMTDIDYE